MSTVMNGIRVIELAGWTFVPAAGAVLADWGAEVIKIEHPATGDPQRGLRIGGLGEADPRGINFIMEQPNRGKRSVGLDASSPAGREALLRLVAQADVFLTNLLPDSIERLGLTNEVLREANPKIIIARGHGQGVRGPDAQRGGFDGASYWARGSVAAMFSPEGALPQMQRPAFGDIVGGLTIAGGIAGALLRRERTGEPGIVDVSLLGMAVWAMSPDIVAAGLVGDQNRIRFAHEEALNPLSNLYRTQDGRAISLVLLQADRYWPDLCEHLNRRDLVDDPRFATSQDRFVNRRECVAELEKVFASATLEQWRERLATLQGVWAPVQTPGELHTDVQVLANGYLPEVEVGDGSTFRLAASPMQYDERPPDLRRAPEHGQDTEQVCLDFGFDWDEIIALKEAGVLL